MAQGDLIAKLGACKLFEDLSKSDLKKVAERIAEDHFPAKTTILNEAGEGMGFFFVVLDGSATVVHHGKEGAVLTQRHFPAKPTPLTPPPPTPPRPTPPPP